MLHYSTETGNDTRLPSWGTLLTPPTVGHWDRVSSLTCWNSRVNTKSIFSKNLAGNFRRCMTAEGQERLTRRGLCCSLPWWPCHPRLHSSTNSSPGAGRSQWRNRNRSDICHKLRQIIMKCSLFRDIQDPERPRPVHYDQGDPHLHTGGGLEQRACGGGGGKSYRILTQLPTKMSCL